MINQLLINTQGFLEGVISSNEKGISLRLSFKDGRKYIFIKDTFYESYLIKLTGILNRFQGCIDNGSSTFKLTIASNNPEVTTHRNFVFDRINIYQSSSEWTSYKITDSKIFDRI